MINNEPSPGISGRCQNYYPDLVDVSLQDQRKALSLRRRWWRLKKNIWHIQAMGFIAFLKRKLVHRSLKKSVLQKNRKLAKDKLSGEELHLQPGDLVEIRSEKDIFSTLDEHDKHKGLQFTKEMSKYCGNKCRVLKRVDKILIETTGELRTFKAPTFILEGVFCDGSFHGNCDRTCLSFWREIWLKRVTEDTPEKKKVNP
jgi:hypothetical protein